MVSFDSVNRTALSESSPRTRAVDTLQIHHATTTSLAGLRALMDPGGRQVSANAALGNDGHLMDVVDYRTRRAFTSGVASEDQHSFTVETCNTTGAPDWGISGASHERLAVLAAELHKELGLPLDRAHVIGHREVPGTYATACPGPSMDLNWIVSRAIALVSPTKRKEINMRYGYIWDGGKRYALIHPLHIKDGAIVTEDINVANTFSVTADALGGNGSPQKWAPALFDAEILFAKRLYDLAKAERASVTVGSVSVDLGPLQKAIEALPNALLDAEAARLKS